MPKRSGEPESVLAQPGLPGVGDGADNVSDNPAASPATALLDVGRIARPHGLDGEVVVVLTTDRDERMAVGSSLNTDRGPLTVTRSRPQDRRRWLVTFEGISGRDAAESLRDLVLRGEPIEEPGTLWVHELIGTRVVSRDGTDRGRVLAVVDNPASDLLELDTGALVPLTFVVGDIVDGVVTLDEPDGLFDI